MRIRGLRENPIARFLRVLSMCLVALTVGCAAAAVAGPNEVLIAAATRGDAAAVRTLLANGADVNAKTSKGETALMLASAKGHLDVVKALLAAKADATSRIARR